MAQGIPARARGAVAVGVAVAASWCADLAALVASAALLDGSQLALSSGLAAAAVAVLAALAAAFRLGPAPSLALLAMLVGAASGGPGRALAFAGACAPLALPAVRRWHPAALGLCFGVALSGAFALARRLGLLAGAAVPRGGPEGDLWYAGVLAAGLAGLLGAGALTAGLGRLGRALPALAFAGLLAAFAALGLEPPPPLPTYAAAPSPAAARAPHVLLLVLDTVRADHLSVYGYARDTTPELRRLLREEPRARLYPFAFSPASWTPPSHASLLTGLLPHEHGVHEGMLGRRARGVLRAELTLAELLRERGWRTAAVTANRYLLAIDGLDRGFDWFVQPRHARPLDGLGEYLRRRLLPRRGVKPYPDADAVNRSVLAFLERCDPGPCFVLANYMDAHDPYQPPPPFAGRFVTEHDGAENERLRCGREPDAVLAARYDESIASLDAALGRLFEALAERGLRDDTWIIVTSDHGESFGEHDVCSHGTSLLNAQTRIPLLVVPPLGVKLDACAAGVGLLDVAATVAALAGVADYGGGRDLRTPCRDHPVALSFYGRRHRIRRDGPLAGRPVQGVVSGTRKLLRYEDHEELYDLERDPDETQPRQDAPAAVLEALRAHLPPARPGVAAEAPPSLTPEEIEALEALGYLRDADEEPVD